MENILNIKETFHFNIDFLETYINIVPKLKKRPATSSEIRTSCTVQQLTINNSSIEQNLITVPIFTGSKTTSIPCCSF